jgi:hypothetical protein
MTELLEKGKTFEWTPRQEANFQELKKRLTTAPVLTSQLSRTKEETYYCTSSNYA